MRDMEAGMEQARMNVRQLLESRVRQHPDKAFLIFEDQVISYADFDTTVNRVACGFLRLGIGAGDRVCVMLANCPEFLYAWFGPMKIGAILVPINSAFRRTGTGSVEWGYFPLLQQELRRFACRKVAALTPSK